jgi:hypothetical protein
LVENRIDSNLSSDESVDEKQAVDSTEKNIEKNVAAAAKKSLIGEILQDDYTIININYDRTIKKNFDFKKRNADAADITNESDEDFNITNDSDENSQLSQKKFEDKNKKMLKTKKIKLNI